MSRDDDGQIIGPYFVGDAELGLLGLAAALAARWHARRKDYRQIPSDYEAILRFAQGLALGASVPLDDVGEVYVTIDADSDTLKRLKAMAPSDWERLKDEAGGENEPQPPEAS